MAGQALFVGNSDGIGLAATRMLLEEGWHVTGISRSPTSVDHPHYFHLVSDVGLPEYPEHLNQVLDKNAPVDLCVYCAGMGELMNPELMAGEVRTFSVNLMGMVKTAVEVIPGMVGRGKGHFIGVSSVADVLLSTKAPAYHASKAGFSNYLEGLAGALKPYGVKVTNLRFGFVDTKMAKGGKRPLMMGVDKAARHVMTCVSKKPVRYTAPRIVIPLVALRRWMMKFGAK